MVAMIKSLVVSIYKTDTKGFDIGFNPGTDTDCAASMICYWIVDILN